MARAKSDSAIAGQDQYTTGPARLDGRSADPYRDTAVIDERAPRTNQAVIGAGALIALAAGIEWLVALLAFQLLVGLTLGRRYCLPCLFYFEVIQPRFGEGRIEDAAPPRFANAIGAAMLSAATLAFGVDLETVGWILTAMVAVLAMLAALTGFCVGCAIYRRVWGCETCAPEPRETRVGTALRGKVFERHNNR